MSDNPIIHVHGVTTKEQASALEALGVGQIGVVVGERGVTLEQARLIGRGLKRATLGLESREPLLPSEAKRAGAARVLCPYGPEISPRWRNELRRMDLDWALIRVPAAEDDDPSWIRTRLHEAGLPAPAFSVLEVCPDQQDGWSLLQEGLEDELSIADLDSLSQEFPLLFAFASRPDNLAAIRAALPQAAGWSFTLAGAPGAHTYKEPDLLKLLARL